MPSRAVFGGFVGAGTVSSSDYPVLLVDVLNWRRVDFFLAGIQVCNILSMCIHVTMVTAAATRQQRGTVRNHMDTSILR